MGTQQGNTASADSSRGSAAVKLREIRQVTVGGLLVNLLLSALKIAAGWLGHSYAVLADGIHSISDCVTDVAILVGVRYWSAPPDEKHPHGHRRIETLVTIMIGLLLAAIAIGLAWQSISTIGSSASSAHRSRPKLIHINNATMMNVASTM